MTILTSRTFSFLMACLLVSASSIACSRTAGISGTIFVTMQSGDVKRGADVEVALISHSEKLETAMAGIATQGTEEYAKAKAGLAAAEQALSTVDFRSGFYLDYSKNVTAWQVRVWEIESGVENRLRKVLADARIASTRTDVNGVYLFKDVRRGKYFLYADHKVFKNEISWLVPIEMRGEDLKMDLSNSNSGWLKTGLLLLRKGP